MKQYEKTFFIKVRGGNFPQKEWDNYLKNFDVQFHTTRTANHYRWNRILGKEFEIWISYPQLERDGTDSYWKVKIETRDPSGKGIGVVESLVEGLSMIFSDFKLE